MKKLVSTLVSALMSKSCLVLGRIILRIVASSRWSITCDRADIAADYEWSGIMNDCQSIEPKNKEHVCVRERERERMEIKEEKWEKNEKECQVAGQIKAANQIPESVEWSSQSRCISSAQCPPESPPCQFWASEYLCSLAESR